MTRLCALALAAVVAASAIVPAQARGGSVSLTINPQGRDAEVVREGFQLYSLFKGWKSHGSSSRIDQRGVGNGAAVAQHGNNNVAEIVQRGNGHSGTVTQTGSNNWFGLFQFGRHTTSNVSQNGNGRTGLVIQGGW